MDKFSTHILSKAILTDKEIEILKDFMIRKAHLPKKRVSEKHKVMSSIYDKLLFMQKNRPYIDDILKNID